MSRNPQYTLDKEGNPIGVFLTIEDWNVIADEIDFEIPDWQKRELDERLKTIDDDDKEEMGSFLQSLKKEDENKFK